MSVHSPINPTSTSATSRSAVTLPALIDMAARGEKIAALTCYDALFATWLGRCGVDVALVGDSLGMVLTGYTSTLPVTMADMLYHTRQVANARSNCFIITDMPNGSYGESPAQAYRHASEMLAAGAQMVKLEGSTWLAATVEFLRQRDIPVIAHLGLRPQAIHRMGGYKAQGRDEASAEQLRREAMVMRDAGADMILLEAVPAELGKVITESTALPSIGIGAGPHTSGQVLVLHDMLGLHPGKTAKFVRNFMTGQLSIQAAIQAYVAAVKTGDFPQAEHCFSSISS